MVVGKGLSDSAEVFCAVDMVNEEQVRGVREAVLFLEDLMEMFGRSRGGVFAREVRFQIYHTAQVQRQRRPQARARARQSEVKHPRFAMSQV